jgi:hypothetical protein
MIVKEYKLKINEVLEVLNKKIYERKLGQDISNYQHDT